MQNLSTIHTAVKGDVTPEVREALRTLRASDFRLEAEFYHLDIEGRFEFAEELRGTLDTLTDAQADEIARVVNDLEDIGGEDFSSWDVRCDAAARIRRVIRSIESEQKEVAVNVF